MNVMPPLFGYIGPETTLPLASALAASLGILLAFWGYLYRFAKRGILFLLGRRVPPETPGSVPAPAPGLPASTPAETLTAAEAQG